MTDAAGLKAWHSEEGFKLSQSASAKELVDTRGLRELFRTSEDEAWLTSA